MNCLSICSLHVIWLVELEELR